MKWLYPILFRLSNLTCLKNFWSPKVCPFLVFWFLQRLPIQAWTLKSSKVKVILYPCLFHTLTSNHSLRNADSISRTYPISACPSLFLVASSFAWAVAFNTFSLKFISYIAARVIFLKCQIKFTSWWTPSTDFHYTCDKIQTPYRCLYHCPHHCPLPLSLNSSSTTLPFPPSSGQHQPSLCSPWTPRTFLSQAFDPAFPCPDPPLHQASFFS